METKTNSFSNWDLTQMTKQALEISERAWKDWEIDLDWEGNHVYFQRMDGSMIVESAVW